MKFDGAVKAWTLAAAMIFSAAAGPGTALADQATAESEVEAGNEDYFAGDHAAAEAHYTTAIAEQPTWIIPRSNRGLARYHLGDLDGAVGDLDDALAIDPNYVPALLNRGKCHAAQKQWADAEADFQAALTRRPGSAKALYNLGWVYDEQGLLGDAATKYQAALAADGGHVKARVALGVAEARLARDANAVADFYAAINAADEGDFHAHLAAYNLQLLRGPGVSFDDAGAADDYVEGVFQFSAEQYAAAAASLQAARAAEPDVPDVPWLLYWTHLRDRDEATAGVHLTRARRLMKGLFVESFGSPAEIYIDGIKRGTTPAQLHLFASRYDITLRRTAGGGMAEWVGRAYTDGTPGGDDAMLLNPVAVSDYTPFGPVADDDLDWLADEWEQHWFLSLAHGPGSDETDHDGLVNLLEHWYSTDPTADDTDADDLADPNEPAETGTSPTVANRFFYVNDLATTTDAWCTAPGSDTNDGLTPATPKATVAAVLAAYDLEPGDVVRIDTGTYVLAENIRINSEDGGSPEAPVTFAASPYGVTINRADTAAGAYAWEVHDAENVTITTATSDAHPGSPQRWMRITGASRGVYLYGTGAHVSRLDITGNDYCGIYASRPATIANCLVRNTASASGAGVILSGYADGTVLRNCTVADNANQCLELTGGVNDVVARNNIFAAAGEGVEAVFIHSGSGFGLRDYNLIHVAAGAVAGVGRDRRGFVFRDPLFVNPAAGDYHLASTGGSYHGGAWTADANDSPGIDTGFGHAGNEPLPNGSPLHVAGWGERNLGAYGGTEQGSKTYATRRAWLREPVGGENYLDDGLPVEVRWTWAGTGWQGGEAVALSFSGDAGVTWQGVSGAASVPVEAGRFEWSVAGLPAGPLYRVEAAPLNDATGTDRSPRTFRIGSGLIFYVNDHSTTSDAWCTAAGSSAHDALTPATPMDSVADVLDTYDLEPGDVVRIDTGAYFPGENITVTPADEGAAGAPVTFAGSPYGVTFDRGNTAGGAYAWYIQDAVHVTLATSGDDPRPALPRRWMRISGGYHGVYAAGTGARLARLDLAGNHYYGAYLYRQTTVENCLARGTASSAGAGIGLGSYADDSVIGNCTLVDNANEALALHSGAYGVTLTNCILVASGSGRQAVQMHTSTSFASRDHNLLYAADGATLGVQREPNELIHRDPLFVSAATGDYHLQSTAGSYHGGAWTADAADSPGIDTGFGDAGDEPLPNSSPLHGPDGGARNLGAYGGTELASKTYATRRAWLYEPVGGENFLDQAVPVSVRWTPAGTDWQSGDTANLSYSADSGQTWADMPGGLELDANAGAFAWDITGLAGSPKYRARIAPAGAGAADISPEDFRIGQRAVYYVNDHSTTNDAWCTAAGSDTNDGLTPATPKATVQAVLDAYDLEPGDAVRIDTGTYVLAANITVVAADGGDAETPVTFEASPYGVTIDRDSTAGGAFAWHIDEAPYVTITTAAGDALPGAARRWMRITGGTYGIYARGHGARLSRLDIADNETFGVYVYNPATLENCLVRDTASTHGSGVYLGSSSDGTTVRNCTIIAGGNYGLRIDDYAHQTVLENSILIASGQGRRAVYPEADDVFASRDYNLVHATGGALAGVGAEEHGLRGRDPMFVAPDAGDYHLSSSAGSYHGGAWTADANDSPGIDTGFGDAADEPMPNASPLGGPDTGRRNLGAYGGTELASKTYATRRALLIEPVGGENYLDRSEPIDIRWAVVGTDWQAGEDVGLQVSDDAGATWGQIPGAASVDAAGGAFAWDVSSMTPGPRYRVAVIPAAVYTAVDVSPENFRIGEALTFYVNDAETAMDAWCTAAGDDENDGTSPATPMATVQAVLDTYDLEPGDTVRIDTGTYVPDADIRIAPADGGSADADVTFAASPYGVTVDRETGSGNVWDIDAAHVTITTAASEAHPTAAKRWMRVTGGYRGVYVDGSVVTLSRLDVVGNHREGVFLHSRAAIENCLIRDCTDTYGRGVYVDSSADRSEVRNCTIVGMPDYCIRTNRSADLVTMENCILVAGEDGGFIYEEGGDGVSVRHHNLLYNADGLYPPSHRDPNGFIHRDPLFVDPNAGDYHLQSTAGSYHGGAWTADAGDSPGIDTGAGGAGDEPSPNGSPLHAPDAGRRNLGAYGGTELASKTYATRRAWLYEPVGGENYLDQSIPVGVRWTWAGTDWQGGDTADLAFSADAGATWADMPGGLGVDGNAGAFAWDIAAAAPGPRYRARIAPAGGAEDASPRTFRIGDALTFYVNDANTALDAWCTADGNDLNDGTTPATPMATVMAVLDTYDLEPNDTVRIDTGTYTLADDIDVRSQDAGTSPDAPVTFAASPYGVTIDRADTGSGRYAWNIQGGGYVTITTAGSSAHPAAARRWMRITGGYAGVYAGSDGTHLSRLDLAGNGRYGLFLREGATVEHCLVTGSTDPTYGRGIYVDDAADGSVIRNCTVADNPVEAVEVDADAGSLVLENCILAADGRDAWALKVHSGASFSSRENNLLYATGGATACTQRGASEMVGRDPLFVDPNAGDYHLQSSAGSYHGGAWTADANDSPGIDTGLGDAGDEPAPNATAMHAAGEGARNLGAYGGTEQGSKTFAARRAWLLEPVGGENYLDQSIPVAVRWTWAGTDWQSGDDVVLHSSDDAGHTFSPIPDANAVEALAGAFVWDIENLPGSLLYRVRIEPVDSPATADVSPENFRIGSTTYFYVNDAAGALDIWCTADGNDDNDGLTPGTPKATVQSVLDAYDLEPGDVVQIDTGTYALTSDITVGEADGGDADAQVTFAASPYGVTIDRGDLSSSTSAWHVEGAENVTITTAASDAHPGSPKRWMRITGAYRGVYALGAGLRLSRLDLAANRYFGAYLYRPGVVENCLVRGTTDAGASAGIAVGYYGDGSVIRNCTVADNAHDAIRLDYSAYGVVAENNILVASGTSGRAVERNTNSSLASHDHNLVWVTGGTTAGIDREPHGFVHRDPLFVDPNAGDYHLQSTAGSYHGGTWAADANDSPGIDTGLGDAGDEPAPNASPLGGVDTGRRNLGAYGGTELASKTYATRRAWLIEPVGGENYLDQAVPLDVHWTLVGTDWQAGETLALRYSDDSGATWQDVPDANAVPAADTTAPWDISALTPKPTYRVRTIPAGAPGADDASPRDVRIGEGLVFYVNDADTAGDAWCTADGNDVNDGITPATPKATVQAILATYDLEPGDLVRIDTGEYLLASDIEIGSDDGGSADAAVTFAASPYGVTIDRGSTSSSAYGWEIAGAQHVTVTTAEADPSPGTPRRWMRVTGAWGGVYVGGNSARIRRLDLADNDYYGIYVGVPDATIENCLIRGTTGGGYGIALGSSSDGSTVANCTVVDNARCAIRLRSGAYSVTAENNILVASGVGRQAVWTDSGITLGSHDHNLVYVTDEATHGIDREDRGFVFRDPMFVDPNAGDYHLQSTAGSYHGGAWTADAGDSPGIDTGTGGAGDEPAPNASPLHGPDTGRRNLGAYGGTELASKTYTTRRAWLYEPAGGENYLNQAAPVSVRWTWAGTEWQDLDTVWLEYSEDSGATFATIDGAETLFADQGLFSWDVSSLAVRPTYRARITPTDALDAPDSSLRDFRVGTGLTFYVNDANTALDAWCTAPGNDANDGLTPATPKATIGGIVDTYDLEPGDLVRIDTGQYAPAANITVGPDDGGSDEAAVTFAGSPYGVTIDRGEAGSGTYCWHLNDCGHVTITTAASNAHPAPQRWMRLVGGYHGVYAGGYGCTLRRIEAVAPYYAGFYLNEYTTLESCLARGATYTYGCGAYLAGTSDHSTVRGCTFAGNAAYGMRLGYSAYHITAVDNIFAAGGEGGIALRQDSSTGFDARDFNLFHVTDGAAVGVTPGTHSLVADPNFAHPAGGDYHLRSAAGRYDPATGLAPADPNAWVRDALTSAGIDAGDPASPYGIEPSPSGGRRNLGAYGNTEQASRTDAVIVAATDPAAAEHGPDAGTFTITRTGSTDGELTVAYSVAGSTATLSGPERDIAEDLAGVVTIPDGFASTDITVTPVDDEIWNEGEETVVLRLEPGAGYKVGRPGEAQIVIADDDVDHVPPVIECVYVDGNAWSPDFRAALGSGPGHALRTGDEQLDPLPWTGIDTVRVRFSEHVEVDANALVLTGTRGGTYALDANAFEYDSASRTAVWRLDQPIARDRLTLTVSQAVTDPAGNALDGAWAEGSDDWPTGGPGQPADLVFRFHCLPGDCDGSGRVNARDYVEMKRGMGKAVTAETAARDLDGDGDIDRDDLKALKASWGLSLP